MNRYAKVTIRKGSFIIDLGELTTRKVITVLQAGAAPGSFEKIAELPAMPRADVIKAITRITTYLEAARDLKSIAGLKLIATEFHREEAPPVEKKPGKKKRAGRAQVWPEA